MSQESVSGTDINSNNHTCSFCDNVLSEGIGSTCDFCDADLCESCRNICGDDYKDCGNVYCPDCCKTCEIEQHEICNECLSWPNPRPEFEHIADICPSCDRIFCEEHSSTGSCSDCERSCCQDCPVQYCEIDNWETCGRCGGTCHKCDRNICEQCYVLCPQCKNETCLECAERCVRCNDPKCASCVPHQCSA